METSFTMLSALCQQMTRKLVFISSWGKKSDVLLDREARSVSQSNSYARKRRSPSLEPTEKSRSGHRLLELQCSGRQGHEMRMAEVCWTPAQLAPGAVRACIKTMRTRMITQDTGQPPLASVPDHTCTYNCSHTQHMHSTQATCRYVHQKKIIY